MQNFFRFMTGKSLVLGEIFVAMIMQHCRKFVRAGERRSDVSWLFNASYSVNDGHQNYADSLPANLVTWLLAEEESQRSFCWVLYVFWIDATSSWELFPHSVETGKLYIACNKCQLICLLLLVSLQLSYLIVLYVRMDMFTPYFQHLRHISKFACYFFL